MYKYAQLNDEGFVVGISYLSGEVFSDNMILINDLEVELGSLYNRETGQFTAPIIDESTFIEQEPSIEEQILFENKYQTMILEMGIF